MIAFERLWDQRNRTPVLVVAATIVVVIAVVDWWTKPYVSLGFLYLFPIMVAAAYLPRWAVALLGILCAWLAEVFSSLEASVLRLTFESLALAGCGLFVGELVRNRRLSIKSQARLKALVETSPAAIVTVDDHGSIELANQAAIELLAPRGGRLIGDPIAAYLPELHHAIRWEDAPQFRASLQCMGHRGDGESFTACVWLSTYKEELTPKLAAIIANATEEESADAAAAAPNAATSPGSELIGRAVLTEREMGVLTLVVRGWLTKRLRAEWPSRRAL